MAGVTLGSVTSYISAMLRRGEGGVYGRGYGEVLKQYLTIWKADKQRVLGLFGEVSLHFSMKSISVSVAVLLEIACPDVADIQ